MVEWALHTFPRCVQGIARRPRYVSCAVGEHFSLVESLLLQVASSKLQGGDPQPAALAMQRGTMRACGNARGEFARMRGRTAATGVGIRFARCSSQAFSGISRLD